MSIFRQNHEERTWPGFLTLLLCEGHDPNHFVYLKVQKENTSCRNTVVKFLQRLVDLIVIVLPIIKLWLIKSCEYCFRDGDLVFIRVFFYDFNYFVSILKRLDLLKVNAVIATHLNLIFSYVLNIIVHDQDIMFRFDHVSQ